MASSSLPPEQINEEHHAFSVASSSSSPQYQAFSRTRFSWSPKQRDGHQAFSGIEPQLQRRKVSESSRLYDVFINHRGPDVKDTLALQLYNSLEKLKISAFLDSKQKVHGDSFPSTIENAIHSAKVHIAIFSKGYAESPWCLAELILMLRSSAKIIPVFYGVKPSALRHIEKGVYGKAFADYERKKRYMEKLEEWKAALLSISFIAGEELNSFSDCEKIVSAVQKEVEKKKTLYVAKHPVGLHKLVADFEKRCMNNLVDDFESQCGISKRGQGKAEIVAIFGMGGVGKTTLCKEFFNRKRSDYSRSCFLFDVRDSSVKCNLPSLQMKLLSDLFDENRLRFSSVEDGTSCLNDCIQRSSTLNFLIVLDDVDHLEQLDALLITDMLNKSGNSLIIVTTRDVGLVINAGITVAHNLRGMDTNDAKELFCFYAFGQSFPSAGYEQPVDRFVELCSGLPLSLQVLGRHVRGRDQKFWELELKKAKKTLPHDIQKRLRLSIDTLDNEEKQIFMDVACFFIGELKKDAIGVWEASGWSAQHALRRLKDKCLIEEVENYYEFRPRLEDVFENSKILVLRMHDHLRDLGRQMADELSHPRRLWRSQHLHSLISNGFESISSAQHKIRCLNFFLNPSMYLYIKYFLGQSDTMIETSTALLWLELDLCGRRLPSIPPCFPLQNLQFLSINGGSLERLWQDNEQAPLALKELSISKIRELNELRSGLLRCLEKLTICDCRHLQSVSEINNHTKLVELNIFKWWELKQLSVARNRRLEKIRILNCVNLQSVTMSHLMELKELNVSQCQKMKELNFVRLGCLERITVYSCSHLKSVTGFSDLTNLVDLNISKCGELEELNFARLCCLKRIEIHNCGHLKSVMGISDLTKLVELNITGCEKIEELCLVRLTCLEVCFISDVPALKNIEVKGCTNLMSVNGMLGNLVKLRIGDCPELKKMTAIKTFSSLERMELLYCDNETIKDCIQKMEKLPSHILKIIGKAEDGAESTLDANLFCDFNSANSVIQIGTENTCSHLGKYMVSAIILCIVVVVNTSSAAKTINDSIGDCDCSPWLRFEVRKGKWIITSVTSKEDEIKNYILNKGYCFPFDYLYFPEDVMVKTLTMPVMRGEEHKILNVLRIILDKLYQK